MKKIARVRLGEFDGVTVYDGSKDYGIPTVLMLNEPLRVVYMKPKAAAELGRALIKAAKSARK